MNKIYPDFGEDSVSLERVTDIYLAIDFKVGELPERAEAFGDSVSRKAEDIYFAAKKRGSATAAQFRALENMLDGINRWLE